MGLEQILFPIKRGNVVKPKWEFGTSVPGENVPNETMDQRYRVGVGPRYLFYIGTELGSDHAICFISTVCRPKYSRFQVLEDRF